jgi:hypothetical protein
MFISLNIKISEKIQILILRVARVPKSDRKILTSPYKIRIVFLLLSHRNGRNVARGILVESDQNRFQGRANGFIYQLHSCSGFKFGLKYIST